jgi:hypothetical protein
VKLAGPIVWVVLMLPAPLLAATLVVTDQDGEALATAMVTRSIPGNDVVDTSDNGYPKAGLVNSVVPQFTLFTGSDGIVRFDPTDVVGERKFRVRKQGYFDAHVTADSDDATLEVNLELLLDDKLIAESKPANLWLSELDFNWAEEPALAREHFLLHCGFCHQQASVFMRLSRTEEQWVDIIDRMQMYGAMASEDFVDGAPAGLAGAYDKLNQRYAELPPFEPWEPGLSSATITEWSIGDELSQMHDIVLHPNGKVSTRSSRSLMMRVQSTVAFSAIAWELTRKRIIIWACIPLLLRPPTATYS